MWKTHSGQLLHASGSVLLIVASNFHGFVAHYTLNKLDTAYNGIYVVRNPRAGYVTTLLCSVVITTTLRFLNHVGHLDSVSNYYVLLYSPISRQYLMLCTPRE